MPISLFKVFTSLKIVSCMCSGQVYARLNPLTVSNGRSLFVQLFSVCVSVLQKVFPEPLFKEIKLSSFLSYHIVLLSSSMYTFGNYLKLYFSLLYIPLFWSGSSMSTRTLSVSFTFGPSEPRTVPGTYFSRARIMS